MLAVPSHGFVMLSMPKCASSSLAKAVADQAEVVLQLNPGLKHLNCKQFHELLVPVLRKGGYTRKDYEVVSLFREPLEWLESWWRYRRRRALAEVDGRYTGASTFEQFAVAYLERRRPVRGRPARFVAMGDDLRIGVDRLFALERPDAWQRWLTERLGGDLSFESVNASSVTDQPALSASTRARLEAYFAPEYDIYARLGETGSWAPPRGWVPRGAPDQVTIAPAPPSREVARLRQARWSTGRSSR